jgi:hypothetical protein
MISPMNVVENEKYLDQRKLLAGVASGGALAALSVWVARVAAVFL